MVMSCLRVGWSRRQNSLCKIFSYVVLYNLLLRGTVLCALKSGTDGPEIVVDKEDHGAVNEVLVVSPQSSNPTQKRRKQRVNSIVLAPDDIRLAYPRKYFDAVNTADIAIVREMFSELAIPKVVLLSRKLTPDPEFYLPMHLEVRFLFVPCCMNNFCFFLR